MRYHQPTLKKLAEEVSRLYESIRNDEKEFMDLVGKVNPRYRKSARNLVQYLSLRKHDIRNTQKKLGNLGLSRLARSEGHLEASIMTTQYILQKLSGTGSSPVGSPAVGFRESEMILGRNSRAVLGRKPRGRRSRIMVTLPDEAATDYALVKSLISAGMNLARINCAYGDTFSWKKTIDHIRKASGELNTNCRVAMDLAGPKIRTGSMKAGPQVLFFQPERDPLGRIVQPSHLWLAPPKSIPPEDSYVFIPVPPAWLRNVEKGDIVLFTDNRGKERRIEMMGKEGKGRLGRCVDSAYITTGTELKLLKKKHIAGEVGKVGELLPMEERIVLREGDILLITRDQIPGEPAVTDDQGRITSPAHISCTLPEVFSDVRPGETILLDDGKIAGLIETVNPDALQIKILFAKNKGSKLRADKGINLPDSRITVSGMTPKDREDLRFISRYADIVDFSFVNKAGDVEDLLDELKKLKSTLGVILKIETRQGYINLPDILLTAMQTFPIGVMIARGDLAVECGWNEMARIQEEILFICQAAHLPDVWATQVLETMAKKGLPSRAEITDAAMSQRAECVMLNKGPHITKAIVMLDEILSSMQDYQEKKASLLPSLFAYGKK
ncbi:MAG: hypothetical protein JW861_13830 [Bacteroidales bacterium]|nr:hypothetical protein [Bacteroidales bacterium]